MIFLIDIITRTKKTVFKLARKIPSIRKQLDSELNKVDEDFKREVKEQTKNLAYITELPMQGLSDEEICSHLNKNLDLGNNYIICIICLHVLCR